MQLVTTRAGARLGIRIRRHPDRLHLLLQLLQHVTLRIEGALQRGQHLIVLGQLSLMVTQLFATAATIGLGVFQTLTQTLVEVGILAQHAHRIAVTEVRAPLGDLRQGEGLLLRQTLRLLRLLVVLLQLLVLLRIALQHLDHRLQRRERGGMLVQITRRLLRLLPLLA